MPAHASDSRFALGLDFGTNSVRALIVDVADGSEVATAVAPYPSGDQGILTDPHDPDVARQHPGDYLAAMQACVRQALACAEDVKGFAPDRVVGIGVDATGSTPIPVDRQGVPLAMHNHFRDNLAAQAWLWKDHTAHAEAGRITQTAREMGLPYLDRCGGAYSSEWYWAKILHCRRTVPGVFDAAWSWVEQSDYIPAWLVGHTDPTTMPRNGCAAGHKAMYAADWGGLPSEVFLAALDPALVPLRSRYAPTALPSDRVAGRLCPQAAETLGLPAGLPVAVGLIDAHAGAVGAGIDVGTLVKTIGTSTCDMMVSPGDAAAPQIPGLCGVAHSSIIPGMWGLEAGQSAVGDLFNWFVRNLVPVAYTRDGDPHAALTLEAARLRPGQSGLLALDWNNGNRSILTDPRLTGLIVGQTLETTAPQIYRAIIEATAFGALTIIRRIEEHGIAVERVINCGGIAEKNPLVMQIYADVCNRPMWVSRSAQTCALGAAIFGAVVGGAYRSVTEAQQRMTGLKDVVYHPEPAAIAVYAELYELYQQLHDAFGTKRHVDGLDQLMKRLLTIRDAARRDAARESVQKVRPAEAPADIAV